jgi:Protein of unknown function (DUF2934)
MQNLDQAIRERAYYLWIANGCPEGSADAHWLDAQRELLAASFAVSAPEAAEKPKKKPATRSRRKAA